MDHTHISTRRHSPQCTHDFPPCDAMVDRAWSTLALYPDNSISLRNLSDNLGGVSGAIHGLRQPAHPAAYSSTPGLALGTQGGASCASLPKQARMSRRGPSHCHIVKEHLDHHKGRGLCKEPMEPFSLAQPLRDKPASSFGSFGCPLTDLHPLHFGQLSFLDSRVMSTLMLMLVHTNH